MDKFSAKKQGVGMRKILNANSTQFILIFRLNLRRSNANLAKNFLFARFSRATVCIVSFDAAQNFGYINGCCISSKSGSCAFNANIVNRESANIQRSGSLNAKVLVLNQSYEPISICSAKKAFMLLYLTKAELVEFHPGSVLRSVNVHFVFPSVIRLFSYVRISFRSIELSRKNVMRRDNGRCQYCGKTTPPLTVDHVMPRSRGGKDTWENLTTACMRCNNRKGNCTPEEARMPLLSLPQRPSHVVFLRQLAGSVEETWRPYLFMD